MLVTSSHARVDVTGKNNVKAKIPSRHMKAADSAEEIGTLEFCLF